MKGRRSKSRRNNNNQEDENDNNSGNQQVMSQERAPLQKYGWALHHFFPDTVPSQRLPDYLVYPTHVFTSALERSVTVRTDGRFVIYWNPALTCQYAGLSKPTAAKDYCHYADSGYTATGGTNISSYITGAESTNAISDHLVVKYIATGTSPDAYYLRDLARTTTANLIAPVTTSETSFNRLRLLSAYLQISYTGKELEVSGLIKVGLNTLRAGQFFAADSVNAMPATSVPTQSFIDINLVNTYPVYKVFKADKTINVFYRIVDETLFNFGPYDTSIDLPYYLITGEGLPPGSNMFVRVVRTFEGVLKPSQNELCNPQTEASGIIGTKQHEVMSRMFKDLSPIISKEDYENFKSNIFKE